MEYRRACPRLEPLGIRAGDWCSFPRWEGTIMMHRTFGLAVCAGALLALLSAVSGDAQAQSAVITGKVTGRGGEALGGATVLVEGLGISAGTAQSGTYTLTVPADKAKGQTVTLRARYIGYQAGTKQITLTPGTQTQDFELKFDPMTLDVVIVTGTAGGTELKKVPFAVSQVDRSQLQEAPAVSALGSLEGKVAGVRLIDASGAPGGEPVIRLRSATALTSKSACTSQPCPSTNVSGPLIIVDGTITRHGLADINSQDIDRVELVKGAAASSLYGSDAANGVIQIFTKRGDKLADGRLAVTVRNEYGQSVRPKTIPVSLAHPYLVDTIGTYTDGAGNVVHNGDFIAANGDFIGPLDLPSIKPSGIAEGPGAPFFAVTFIEPYINLFAPNPDGTPYAAVIPHQLPNAANPLYTLANEHLTTDRTRITGYAKATYRIFDWLSLEGNYNYDEESSNFTDETPKNFLNSSGVATTGQLVKIDSGGRTFNTGVTLTSTRNLNFGGVRIHNTTKAAYIYEDQPARSLGG